VRRISDISAIYSAAGARREFFMIFIMPAFINAAAFIRTWTHRVAPPRAGNKTVH
jgi:hypothetical protein